MIALVIVLSGGLLGLWLHYYLIYFARRVSYAVYQNYTELFAAYPPPPFSELQSSLRPLNRGDTKALTFERQLDDGVHSISIMPVIVYRTWSFLLGAVISLICYLLLQNPLLSLLLSVYLVLLITISLLDWHYQLIDVSLVQMLAVLGMIGSWQRIIPLTLEQSLQSAVSSFAVFWLIYHAARRCYNREALGRGDYWLVGGLAAFVPVQSVPLMILIACLAGLIYAVLQKVYGKSLTCLPFAPFLSLGGVFTFAANVLA